jgi:phenylacetate-coenzyme A ligase PaaK-like adenylate-forming protein
MRLPLPLRRFTRQYRDFDAASYQSKFLASATPEDIERMQWERIRHVWSDCVTDVIYYRNLVESGEAPTELKSWEDVRKIPMLERRTLQDRQGEFRRLSGLPDEIRMTGGSTGTPVRIGVRKAEAKVHRIAKLILWQRVGYCPSAKLFLLWGHHHLLGIGYRRILNHAIRKFKDRLLGYLRVDAYSLSPEKCERIAKELLSFKPFGLIGYASALDYLVRSTPSFHAAFGQLNLGFVMPAGEVAPRPDTYQLLERVFRCPVIEEYAGVEFGQVAMRSGDEFETFHDLNYVEASEETSDEANQLLVTSLYDRYIPLIRYAPGDSIIGATRLSHGHVSRFRAVKGRVHDAITLPSGITIHSMAIFHCVHQEQSVLNIQMVLRDDGPVFRLVVDGSDDRSCERRIRERLGSVAPELGSAPIAFVPDVATTRAGKRRWIHDERTGEADK